MWCSLARVTPYYASGNPSCRRKAYWAYERLLLCGCYERTLLSPRPIPFPVQRPRPHGGESAPAASGGRTFWNIPALRTDRNRSDPAAETHKPAVEPQPPS